jgi:hypothetical protein
MYEGLAALAKLDNATIVRDEVGMLKKVFMEQLQDIAAPKPRMTAAPMPPKMSQPVFRYDGGQLVNGGKVDGDDYVVDAYTVAALGNGSSSAGAKALDQALPQVQNTDGSTTGMVEAASGDGMSDNVSFKVENGGDIVEARISPDEYIIDANQVKALGDGDADVGSDRLDKLREEIRQQTYGTKKQPKEMSAAKTLREFMKEI